MYLLLLFQNHVNLHTVNMGCRNSKRKFNKEGENQKICKIGLSFGRNDLKVEGNFQAGYHSKINKKYTAADGSLSVIQEEPETLEEN